MKLKKIIFRNKKNLIEKNIDLLIKKMFIFIINIQYQKKQQLNLNLKIN